VKKNNFMKDIFKKFGVVESDNAIYEFESIKLDWWDSKNKTSVEIEIQYDEDWCCLDIIFCPEVDEIVERIIVYSTVFKDDKIAENTLIAEVLLKNLKIDNSLSFSEENNAYLTDSFSESKKILAKILDLVKNTKPINIINIDEIEEDEDFSELGETLNHFVAMMVMNSTEFTKENIIKSLELAIQIEGVGYLKELRIDAITGDLEDYEEEFEIDTETLKLLVEVIGNYSE
jgi:hypothetical protein